MVGILWKEAIQTGDILIIQTRSDTSGDIRFSFRGFITEVADEYLTLQVDLGKKFIRSSRPADIIWANVNSLLQNFYGKGKTGIILEGDQMFVYPQSPDLLLTPVSELIEEKNFIDMSVPVLVSHKDSNEDLEGVLLKAGINGAKIMLYKEDSDKITSDEIFFFSEIPVTSGFHQFMSNGVIVFREHVSDGIDDYEILYVRLSLDEQTTTIFSMLAAYLFGNIQVDLTPKKSKKHKSIFSIFKRR